MSYFNGDKIMKKTAIAIAICMLTALSANAMISNAVNNSTDDPQNSVLGTKESLNTNPATTNNSTAVLTDATTTGSTALNNSTDGSQNIESAIDPNTNSSTAVLTDAATTSSTATNSSTDGSQNSENATSSTPTALSAATNVSNYQAINVDLAFEVLNGLTGMRRDVIIRLCVLIGQYNQGYKPVLLDDKAIQAVGLEEEIEFLRNNGERAYFLNANAHLTRIGKGRGRFSPGEFYEENYIGEIFRMDRVVEESPAVAYLVRIEEGGGWPREFYPENYIEIFRVDRAEESPSTAALRALIGMNSEHFLWKSHYSFIEVRKKVCVQKRFTDRVSDFVGLSKNFTVKDFESITNVPTAIAFLDSIPPIPGAKHSQWTRLFYYNYDAEFNLISFLDDCHELGVPMTEPRIKEILNPVLYDYSNWSNIEKQMEKRCKLLEYFANKGYIYDYSMALHRLLTNSHVFHLSLLARERAKTTALLLKDKGANFNYIDPHGRTLLDITQDFEGVVNKADQIKWIRDNGGLLSSEL